MRWKDTPELHSGHPGVYFIFVKVNNEDYIKAVGNHTLYIGTSSSHIGNRLEYHVNKERWWEQKYSSMYIAIIPFSHKLSKCSFLASALEEFLIKHVQNNGILLLNERHSIEMHPDEELNKNYKKSL